MVGVPGRSKGCVTCLKRRLKVRSATRVNDNILIGPQCDEGKPTCRRCEKSGYCCKGYNRKLDVRFHAFGNGRSTSRVETAAPERGIIAQATIPPDLSLVAFKDDIQYTFLFSNLVWSHYGSPWLQLSAAGKLGILALEACQAFSLDVFGMHHHLSSLELDGARCYSRAVSKLSAQLSAVGEPGSADLLIPVMILLLHSVGPSSPCTYDLLTAASRQRRPALNLLCFTFRPSTSCCNCVVRKPLRPSLSEEPSKAAGLHW